MYCNWILEPKRFFLFNYSYTKKLKSFQQFVSKLVRFIDFFLNLFFLIVFKTLLVYLSFLFLFVILKTNCCDLPSKVSPMFINFFFIFNNFCFFLILICACDIFCYKCWFMRTGVLRGENQI